jgi:hypothetical protein
MICLPAVLARIRYIFTAQQQRQHIHGHGLIHVDTYSYRYLCLALPSRPNKASEGRVQNI